jgi:hypothetical protein
MQTRDQDATCKKSLQTKGFRVQRAYARVLREHALQRKCLTASDRSCLIVRYFFITWESVAPLNTFELLDRVAVDAMLQVVQPAQKRGPHKGLSELRVRGVPEQERRDCHPAAPAPKAFADHGGAFIGKSHA